MDENSRQPLPDHQYKLQNEKRFQRLISNISGILDKLMTNLSKVSHTFVIEGWAVTWKHITLGRLYFILNEVIDGFYTGQDSIYMYINVHPDEFIERTKQLEGLVGELINFGVGITENFNGELQRFDERIVKAYEKHERNGVKFYGSEAFLMYF